MLFHKGLDGDRSDLFPWGKADKSFFAGRMRVQVVRSACAALAALVVLASVIPVARASFKSFDPPGSKATNPNSINAQGAVAGSYIDSGSGNQICFISRSGGSFVTFRQSGDPACGGRSINNKMFVTGGVGTSGGGCNFGALYQAYIRSPAGKLTTFAPTSAITTVGRSINIKESIAGFYLDRGCVYHGFIRYRDGTISTIDIKGAGSGQDEGTLALSLNARSTVTGLFIDSRGRYHGFVLDENGIGGKVCGKGCHIFNIRGANKFSPGGFAINSHDVVAGSYLDSSGVNHGFVRTKGGEITILNDPAAGSGKNQGTIGYSLNDDGVVVGYYVDSTGVQHGFVLPPGGTYKNFDLPYSTLTKATSINTKGEITGWYIDSRDSLTHGFLRIP